MGVNQGPQRTRVYDHSHLDSTRWDGYRPRDDDIIISTSVKAGTTWTQRILSLFIFGAGELPTGLWQVSPWIDNRFFPIDDVLAGIEAQEHRRFLKSHLPLDALPFYKNVQYLCVGRDTRDVAMSLFNHYANYTELTMGMLHSFDADFPHCPDDVREFWRNYMTRGAFEWEGDGWPFWSHHYHATSFWEHREQPNIHFVHYNDLKADLEGEMRRIAETFGFTVADDGWPALVEAASFAAMKEGAKSYLPEANMIFGSTDNFIYKGTNERWRDALAEDDLALYDQRAAKLDPDLRRWLECGRIASGITP